MYHIRKRRKLVGAVVFATLIFLVPGTGIGSGEEAWDSGVARTTPATPSTSQPRTIPFEPTFLEYRGTIDTPEGSSALDTARLDSVIVVTMDEYHIPGMAACVVKDGRIVWNRAYGYAHVENNVEVSDATLFMLGSISKTFVATALMQLWEKGLFDLDDDVNDYLPFDVVNPYHPDAAITFRMILAHTSSIARNDWLWFPSMLTWGADSPIPLNEFLQDWLVPGGVHYSQANYKLYPPGGGGEYSNIAYTLAGLLVEEISDLSFEQYCQDSIFTPLGMNETSWFLSELDIDHIAMPTGWDGDAYFSYGQFGFPVYPAGQLRTSSLQLARHLIAFMQKGRIDDVRVLDSTTVEMMTTVQYPGIAVLPGVDWGLGWYGFDTGSGWMWGHEGGIYGVTTLMYFSPTENSGVIYLTNGDGTNGHGIIAVELFEFARDPDLDGIISGYDNCPSHFNPDQADADSDGIGDVCEMRRGDVNGDGAIDLLDVLETVNHILGTQPIEQDDLWRSDCNGDGVINVLDVLGTVNVILGTGTCVP
ncbi:MAG: serine hydrolase [Gemmatimonadota bacterium]|nr:MAG: serine hydrolase [Gemmatimonadota bacterium]